MFLERALGEETVQNLGTLEDSDQTRDQIENVADQRVAGSLRNSTGYETRQRPSPTTVSWEHRGSQFDMRQDRDRRRQESESTTTALRWFIPGDAEVPD